MEKNEIIIKLTNTVVRFSPHLSIGLGETNIKSKYLKFRSNVDIFWKVQMLTYNLEDKCLFVKVVDYNVIDTTLFHTQEPKKEITRLVFEGKFDWLKLEPLLTSYIKNQFQHQLFNHEPIQLPELPKTDPIAAVGG